MSRPWSSLSADQLEILGTTARAAGDQKRLKTVLDELDRRSTRRAQNVAASLRQPRDRQPPRLTPSVAKAPSAHGQTARRVQPSVEQPSRAGVASKPVGNVFQDAREAVRAEHAQTSRTFKLTAQRVEPVGTGLFRVTVGHLDGLERAWEGGSAYARDDSTDSGQRSDPWCGDIHHIDEMEGSIYIGLRSDESRQSSPQLGSFFVKPFEFNRFLAKVFEQADTDSTLRARLTASLNRTAGDRGHALNVSLGIPEFDSIWSHSWAYLWGPPGTGKTYSVGLIVAEALRRPHERILVVSTTNKATDSVALSIWKHAERFARLDHKDIQGLRMGSGADLAEFRSHKATSLLDGNETVLREQLGRLRRELDASTTPTTKAKIKREIDEVRRGIAEVGLKLFDKSRRVVITTIFKAVAVLAQEDGWARLRESGAPFSTIIIDEAGLVGRAATAALSLLADKRVLLVGDPRQLAPISAVARVLEPARKRWLCLSGLEHVEQRLGGDGAHMLTTQYRMAPGIRHVVSSYRYEGRLNDAPSVTAGSRKDLVDAILSTEPAALWYVLDEDGTEPHAIRAERPDRGTSWERLHTLKVLGRIFESHPRLAAGRGIFLSPFAAQAREVQTWLANRPGGRPDWTASTVHAQQGAEADYVIFDTVHATSTAWPRDEWERLVNVGLSRAKLQLILIASRHEMRQPFLAPLVRLLAPRILKGSGGQIRWREVSPDVTHGASQKVREFAPHSLGAQFDARRSMLALLSAEQERLCNLKMDGGPRLVRGVAGSGKTVVLARWVAQIAAHEPRTNIWVVYGNASLRPLVEAHIHDAFGDLNAPATNGIEYHHIKHLLASLYKEAAMKLPPDQWDYDLQAEAYLEHVPNPRTRCDSVFIDEAQDMGPNTLKLLNLLVRPRSEARGMRQAVIFYDNAQNIYGRGMPTWSNIGLTMQGRSTVMKESFRSTTANAALALNVLYRLNDPSQDPDHRELVERGLIVREAIADRSWWHVNFCRVAGPPATFSLYADREAERAALAREVARLIEDEGVRPRDIRVLTNRKSLGDYVGAELTASLGRAVRVVVQRSEAFDGGDDCLIVTTPHSFKGYEAEVVFVFAADSYVAEEQILAQGLYVSLTRARSLLRISASRSSHPGSEIVKVLCDAVADLNSASTATLDLTPSPVSSSTTSARVTRQQVKAETVGVPPPLVRHEPRADLLKCPQCSAKVRKDRLEGHLARHIRKTSVPQAPASTKAKKSVPKAADSTKARTNVSKAPASPSTEAKTSVSKAADSTKARTGVSKTVASTKAKRPPSRTMVQCPLCNFAVSSQAWPSHVEGLHRLQLIDATFGRCPVCSFNVKQTKYLEHLARHAKPTP